MSNLLNISGQNNLNFSTGRNFRHSNLESLILTSRGRDWVLINLLTEAMKEQEEGLGYYKSKTGKGVTLPLKGNPFYCSLVKPRKSIV